MNNTDAYRIFMEVAKEGSFSKAARNLYITQPAVSQAISGLEEKNGVRLFYRLPRGVVRTSEGEILMEYIEPALTLINDAERHLHEAGKVQNGEIRISASDTFCMYYLPPYLAGFRKKYPNIRINIANKTSSETIEMLNSGKADLGIINIDGVLDKRILLWKKEELESVFIIKKGSDELKYKKSPQELANLPLMTLEKGTTTREHLDAYFRNEGVVFKPSMELGSVELLLRFTSIGMGISCISKEFLEKSPYRRNIDVLEAAVPISKRSIGVVTLNRSIITGAAKAFIDLITGER